MKPKVSLPKEEREWVRKHFPPKQGRVRPLYFSALAEFAALEWGKVFYKFWKLLFNPDRELFASFVGSLIAAISLSIMLSEESKGELDTNTEGE